MTKLKNRKVVIDKNAFDLLQIRVLQEVASEIKNAVDAAGISRGKARELTENLTFGIAAIVDGSRVMELDGAPVKPILTFKKGAANLISAEDGSWMHEYAIGTVEEMFDRPQKVGPQIWMLRIEFADPMAAGIAALSIGVNMSKAEDVIVKEISADTERFKNAKYGKAKIAKAFLIGPDGRKKKFDVKPLIASGFNGIDIYKIFKHANQAG